MNLLILSVGRRVELIQAFRDAALSLGTELRIYGDELTDTAPALSFCDGYRRIKPIRDPEYIDSILAACREDHIDLVIPTIDTNLQILSEHREQFAEIGTRLMVSAPEMIRICRDKRKTSRFFIECGLRAPLPVDDITAYAGGYPAFIKPRDGSSSINAFKADTPEELQTYASGIEDYVIQPYIDGREYTVDIFCDWEGNPLSIVPRERLQVRSGEVLKTGISMDETIIAECRKICTAFRPCGPLTVQLIRDETGTDWYIEINPRFGGGAPLSMAAGSKSAEAMLRLLMGESLSYQDAVADGAIYSRFDQSVCVRETEHPVRGVILDLDDTLYSEKEYVKSGYRAVSDYLGGDYTERLWAFFLQGKVAITELLEEIGRIEEDAACLEVYRSHKPEIHLYEGVRELIHQLKSEGKRVGIITDGRPAGQRNKLEALGLYDLIDETDIIITDELGGIQFRKPCDIAFRILQRRWRIPMNELIYIGDNPAKDFQAPGQLGMRSLWFRNEDGLYAHRGKEDAGSVPRIKAIPEATLVLGGRQ